LWLWKNETRKNIRQDSQHKHSLKEEQAMATPKKPVKAIKKDEPKRIPPPPAAEAAKVSKGKDKAAAKQQAAAELASEMRKLRAELKEILRQAGLRIEGRIADTLRILEKKQAPGEPGALPGAKASLQLAKKLRGLKLKAGKGRLKDIARISQLTEKIAKKMPKKS
jgi:hypothetical protein